MTIIDDSMPIGMIGHKLRSDNIFDINQISSLYLNKQKILESQNKWNFDATLIGGSKHRSDLVFKKNADVVKDVSIWSINHYLGLNRNDDVIQAGINALTIYGTGSGTSAMSGGHCELHKKVQLTFSTLFKKQESIFYPTGFTANLGAISGIMKGNPRKNLILIDEECHASIIDGCKLSGSRFLRFKHNSINDLKLKLTKYQNSFVNVMVIVESIYSMSGEIAPLTEIAKLKNHFNFIYYVDESHSFGLYGKKGEGLCHEMDILDAVDIIMTTLSKSCASIGGIISTSHEFCSLLRWSTSYLYQASVPPHDAAIILKSLELISRGMIQQQLKDKVKYLRTKLKNYNFDIGDSEGAIIPIYIRDDAILKKMERLLVKYNIFTIAIQYPIVDKKESRFRFIVNLSHTYEDLDNLICSLLDIRKLLK